MTNEDTMSGLTQLLSKHSWFDGVGVDKFGKLIVFVSNYTLEIMNTIPDKFENKRVVWQFASSKSEIVKAKYGSEYKPVFHNVPVYALINKSKYTPGDISLPKYTESDIEPDVKFLISELDRLEKICGSNVLQSTFYEVHDGKNAVTTLKNKFPEIYDDVLDLYEEFGFDLIYENIDG